MNAESERGKQSGTNDASSNAFEREREAARQKDMPVKQQNPDGKGVNPSQEGPAQPGQSTP